MLDLSGLDFSGCRLPGANLSGSTAVGTDFSGADFSGAILSGIDFTGCCLGAADFRKGSFDACTFIDLDRSSEPPRLAGASFSGVVIRRREDLAFLEYAVSVEPEGDEGWRTKTLCALRRGLVKDVQENAP
jgi:uncharacterized protein YjbI with pentapeptide repeats